MMIVRSLEQSDLDTLVKIDAARFLNSVEDPDFQVPVQRVSWWAHKKDELLKPISPVRGKALGGGLACITSGGCICGGIIFEGVPDGMDVIAAIRTKEQEVATLDFLFAKLESKILDSKNRSFVRVNVPDGDYDLLRFLQNRGYTVAHVSDFFEDEKNCTHDAWRCTKSLN